MPGGHFTQSASILFSAAPSLDAIEAALGEYEIAKRTPADGERNWMGGYPALLLAYRPSVNGYVLLDIVDDRWPDHMGDTKAEPDLFGAWSLGWFGPYVYPDALVRAVQQPSGLEEPQEAVDRHCAFVRIKLSYVIGASEDTPQWPEDRDPVDELKFVTSIARAVLGADGALCYFNPNGETLHSAASMTELGEYHESAGVFPYALWSNTRLLNPNLPERWTMMDTIGMEQLGVCDHEVCIPPDAYELAEVDNFLRSATDYAHKNGPIIEAGNTMDGPGGEIWQAFWFDESLAPRPRDVLRWRPLDGTQAPQEFKLPPAQDDAPPARVAGSSGSAEPCASVRPLCEPTSSQPRSRPANPERPDNADGVLHRPVSQCPRPGSLSVRSHRHIPKSKITRYGANASVTFTLFTTDKDGVSEGSPYFAPN